MKRLIPACIASLLLAGCYIEQYSPIPFNWVDMNQDGYIVFDEYFYMMSSRLEAVPTFDLQYQWYQADDNRDGVITPMEQWSRLFPPQTVYRARTTF
jgi:hypothetical protein